MRSILIPGLLVGCLAIGCEKNEQRPPKAASAATTMPAGESPNATPVTPAAENPATTNPTVADARQKLQQVTQYVREHKYDVAQNLLNELEANKANLPTSIQSRITEAQAMLNAAKGGSSAGAAGSVKLPGAK